MTYDRIWEEKEDGTEMKNDFGNKRQTFNSFTTAT